MSKAFVPQGKVGLLLLGLLLFAAGIRLGGIAEWSLWEDEETSIYFSQRLEKPYARYFPVFFVTLARVYEVTGVSVTAGRMLSATFGVLSMGLLFAMLRRYGSPVAALVAGLLLAGCLGHVFWSQSIRYYTLLSVVEVAALWLFFAGCENRQYVKLGLAGVLISAAMFIHYTAILLVPVFIGYLILARFTGRLPASYGWKGCLAWGLPMLFGLIAFTPGFLALRQGGATGPSPAVQYPLPLMIRIVAYYGVPMVGLALLSVGLVQRMPQRLWLFLLCVAAVPNLELITLGLLGLANVTWNHAFIAMFGCAGLAGMTVAALFHQGSRKIAWSLALASVAYHGVFLSIYYTQAHGDRSRWREASTFLHEAADIDARVKDNPTILATEPGVVAHYLGCPVDKTQDRQLVTRIPDHIPRKGANGEQWYLMRRHGTPKTLQDWFRNNCDLRATYEAHTGPIDRSVLIYHRGAD